jgi:hypothetical protein
MGWRWIRWVGILDDSQIAEKAFFTLEDDLIRIPWVEGIAARGVARPRDGRASSNDIPVLVLTFAPPDDVMRRAIGEVTAGVNRRFGMRLEAILVQRMNIWTGIGIF